MQIIRSKNELQKLVAVLRSSGKTIGFVPTMGALHAGHLSLLDMAKCNADITITSVFVNKAQFAPNEDFAKYPRDEAGDLAKLAAANVDFAYLPQQHEIYPENFSTTISIGAIGQILEGKFRPHFFDGVALVVTKLLLQVAPDIAIFGEKDYQQLIIVRKLVQELDIPVKILAAPIMREPDGLAMSSRNIYLPEDKRAIAAKLYQTLIDVMQKLQNGVAVRDALNFGKDQLLSFGFEKVDYIELCNAQDLTNMDRPEQSARLLATARLGGVRLLDNVAV